MIKQTKKVEISTSFIWKAILILLSFWFLFLIREVLLILFLAIIVVSAVQPIVDRLEKHYIPRVVSALILYMMLFLVFGLMLSLLIPTVANELKEFTEKIPVYLGDVNTFLENALQIAANYHFEENLQQFIDATSNKLTESITGIFSNSIQFFRGLLKFVVIASLSFYMLVKKDGTRGFLRAMTPKKHLKYTIDIVSRVQIKIGRWLIGQTTLIAVITAFDYLALITFNVPFALIIALIGGLLEIIPYIGPTIAIIPAILAALTISPLTALFIATAYIVIQQFENHILTPLIMKTAVGLNPVVIILVLLIGGTVAGVLGVILAVPFATAIDLFISDLIDKKNLL